MKLRVIGWTYYDDPHFEEGENSYAARSAIIADIKEHGYDFTGWHHEESDRGAPVLNDGKIRRYSQRGWGGLMADVYGEVDPFAYSRHAFCFRESYDEVRMPPEEREASDIIYGLAKELLTEEEYDLLFEDDFTARFPHPELSDKEIYTLSEEEAESVSYSEKVRQLPNCIMKRLCEEDLSEHFELDKNACTRKSDRITLKFYPELEYLDNGDTVTLGGISYTVKNTERFRDVSEEIKLKIMYPMNEGYSEALEIFKNSDLLISIFI